MRIKVIIFDRDAFQPCASLPTCNVRVCLSLHKYKQARYTSSVFCV